MLRGKDVTRWRINYKGFYLALVKYGDGKYLENKSSTLFFYLNRHEKKLKNRGQVKNGQHHWLELDNNPSTEYFAQFEEPKLIYPVIATRLFAVYDEDKFYTNDKCFMITSNTFNLKYLGLLLSSKTLDFNFKLLGSPLGKFGYELRKIYIEQLPIYPATPEQQKPFIQKANLILQLNKDLMTEIKGFKDWLQNTFHIDKLSKKLDKYYELSFDDFLVELKKKKVDIKFRKTQELLKNEFEESVDRISPLIREIRETDKKIDNMVYELYGLNDEEIQIVENSLK